MSGVERRARPRRDSRDCFNSSSYIGALALDAVPEWGALTESSACLLFVLRTSKLGAADDRAGTTPLGAVSCAVSYNALIDLKVLERTNAADDPPLKTMRVMVTDDPYTTKQRMFVLEQSIVVPLPLLVRTTLDPKARGGMVSLIALLQLTMPANTPAGKVMRPLTADMM